MFPVSPFLAQDREELPRALVPLPDMLFLFDTMVRGVPEIVELRRSADWMKIGRRFNGYYYGVVQNSSVALRSPKSRMRWDLPERVLL